MVKLAAQLWSIPTADGAMTTPRQPREARSSTAHTRLRHERSPGRRPITLTRPRVRSRSAPVGSLEEPDVSRVALEQVRVSLGPAMDPERGCLAAVALDAPYLWRDSRSTCNPEGVLLFGCWLGTAN